MTLFFSCGFKALLPPPQHCFTQGGETHIKHRQQGSSSLLFTALAQDLNDVLICFKAPFLFLEVNLHTITSTTVNVCKSTSADRRNSKWPVAKPLPAAKNPKARFSNLLYPDLLKRGKAFVYKHLGNWRIVLQKTPQFISTFLLQTFLDSLTNLPLGDVAFR